MCGLQQSLTDAAHRSIGLIWGRIRHSHGHWYRSLKASDDGRQINHRPPDAKHQRLRVGGHLAAIFSRTVAVGAQCSKTKKLIADWIIWNDFWSVFRLSTANQRQISNHYGFWLVGRRWEEAGIVFNMGHSKHLDEHFSNEFATYYKRWKNIFKKYGLEVI